MKMAPIACRYVITVTFFSLLAVAGIQDVVAQEKPGRLLASTTYVFDLGKLVDHPVRRHILRQARLDVDRKATKETLEKYEASLLKHFDSARLLAIDEIRPTRNGKFEFANAGSPRVVLIPADRAKGEAEPPIKITLRIVGPLVTSQDKREKTFAIEVKVDHKLWGVVSFAEVVLVPGEGGFEPVTFVP